MAEVTQVI